MSWLDRISDKLILFPSVSAIETDWKERLLVPIPQGSLEVWTSTTTPTSVASERVEIAVLKFTGNAGRAENVSCHPFDLIPNVDAKVWAVNHCGYGGSDGRAALTSIASSCEAAYRAVCNAFPNRPIFVCGSSLGCLSALFLAARHPISGLFLRNGPPLPQMIAGRACYNWWNFGLAKILARSLPKELDCVENASMCSIPALFLQSEKDTVVPVKYQDMIFDAYAGTKKKFVMPEADHHDRLQGNQVGDFCKRFGWLMRQATRI